MMQIWEDMRNGTARCPSILFLMMIGGQPGILLENWLAVLSRAAVPASVVGFGPDTYGILTWDFRQDALDRYGVFYESAHNEYFQYLVTMGPLALASYLAFLGGACVRMCRKWKECAWILAPVLAVLCYGAQAVVNINLPIATPIMWAMLAIGLTLTREKAEQAE